jgi:hypothetical protein
MYCYMILLVTQYYGDGKDNIGVRLSRECKHNDNFNGRGGHVIELNAEKDLS